MDPVTTVGSDVPGFVMVISGRDEFNHSACERDDAFPLDVETGCGNASVRSEGNVERTGHCEFEFNARAGKDIFADSNLVVAALRVEIGRENMNPMQTNRFHRPRDVVVVVIVAKFKGAG